MQKPVEKKQDLSWFFLLLLILGVLILLFSQSEDTQYSSQRKDRGSSPVVSEEMARVNRHLKETALNLERDRVLRKIEVSRELQKLQEGHTEVPINPAPSSALSFETDPNMARLAEELDRSQAVHDESAMTPAQIIQRRLYEAELNQKEDAAYREAYAEQLVENARRAGWDVKLGPNFEVLSVRKIPGNPRKPSNLFDPAGSGSN
ncbi:MAG: hypothetical protein ACK5Y2_07120 [Bdellovibrionales bacterium]